MQDFDPEAAADDIIRFIRKFFRDSGGKTAVIGMSGGKDSTITAALCAEALGKENVVGVIMPDGDMGGREEAEHAAELYCGRRYVFSIAGLTAYVHMSHLNVTDLPITDVAKTNLPARLRMAVLYFITQCLEHGRVANTCNLSEDWVGYATRYGDGAGDFAPLHDFTVQEVKAIGHYLGVPEELVEKVPDDGLCGKTDEDNLGFTYEVLDRYIRTGECDDPEIKARIDELHARNLFKLEPIPYCKNGWYV